MTTALAFAAGVGALVAGVVIIDDGQQVGRGLGGVALLVRAGAWGRVGLASRFAFRLMPARTALVRDLPGEAGSALPNATLLLVGLCGAAALQTPAVLTCGYGSMLCVLTIEGPDPSD